MRSSAPEDVTAALTFLFADIRGYTAFTKKRGAEEAARLAARFSEAAHDAIEARGGAPLEIRGDQVLAAFSSASQAVRAAVEMQESFFEEAQDDPTLPLEVGVGLDRGDAVVGPSGYHGDVLNTAARLCSAAGPGEILVTPAVAEQTGTMSGIDYEEAGPLVLKGLGDAVAPLRVLGMRPGRLGAVDAPGEGDLPFELDPLVPVLAGRESDLHWLRGNWRLARRGRARTVFVCGPRGMGKTRLASELARLVVLEGARVWYASAAGGDDALIPIRQLAHTTGPSLVVVADLGSASAEMLVALAEIGEQVAELPVLLICELRDEALNRAEIKDLVDRLDGNRDRVRYLTPLDAGGIVEVARLYAGEAASDLPVQGVLAATGGVPQDVHQAVSLWTRERAMRRLHDSGKRAAKERSELESVESDIALGVTGLELAEGRALLLQGGGDSLACPFKGLVSFDTSDADYFFGRERLVGELVSRLAGTTFLGVVGPSGSGKSSVLRAGLVPALERGVLPGSESWRRVVTRPGAHPVAELHKALTETGFDALPEREPLAAPQQKLEKDQRLVVVLDQFEEVFTTCSEEERTAFIGELTRIAGRDGSIAWVVAIRADFYGRCAAYERLAELFARNHVLVGAMNEEELRRAIEMPARRGGLWIEPELLNSIVADVKDAPGALPIVSTTLVELWDHRSGRSLRVDAYERIGRMEGAIARLAEGVFANLVDRQQVIARAILLRLAGPWESDSVVRRQAALSEFDLEDNEDVAEVLSLLTAGRLLSVGEGTVEVAHEALLREWPRLRGWLEDDRQGRQLHRHLIASAREWDATGRDPAESYRGARLAATLEWGVDHDSELNDLERSFLEESAKLQEREKDKATRRLRLAAVATLLVAVVLALATAVSLAQRNSAQEQRETAERQQRLAFSREVAASAAAQFRDDPELGLLLAIEAVRIAPTQQAVDALRESIGLGRVRTTFREANARLVGAMFNQRGDRVITRTDKSTIRVWDPVEGDVLQTFPGSRSEWDGISVPEWDAKLKGEGGLLAVPTGSVVQIWDISTGDRISVLRGHSQTVWDVDLDLTGARAVTVSHDGTGRLWEVATGKTLHVLGSRGQADYTAEFSSSENRVITAGADSAVRIWNATTGELEHVLRAHKGGVGTIGLSHDGAVFATGGQDGSVRLWDIKTGDQLALLQGHEDWIDTIAWSPDGERVVTGSSDRTARLWDADTGRTISVLERGGSGLEPGVAYSPDGSMIATASSDQVARVWDGTTGHLLAEFRGHSAAIVSVAFSPDGRFLLTASKDNTARKWDLRQPNLVAVLAAASGWVNDAEFSPDGRFVVTSSDDNRARLWSTKSWKPIAVVRHRSTVHDGEFTPDSRYVVTVGRDRTARVWAVPSGKMIAVARHPVHTLLVEFSHDGSKFVTSDVSGGNRVWDTATGERIATLGRTDEPAWAEFSPDGSVVATDVGPGGTARVWDADTGRQLGVLRHGGKVLGVAFSPDGGLLATASEGDVYIWDPETWKRISILKGDEALRGVAFSRDGRLIVAPGDESGTAWVWNVASGENIAVLRTSADRVYDAGFSPDAELLVTANDDGTAQVFDVATSRKLADLVGHVGEVIGASFSPDGELVLTAGQDSTARVWTCLACRPVRELLALAEESATRTLTAEERALYLHEKV